MDALEVANWDLERALEDTKQKLKDDFQKEHDRKLAYFTAAEKSLRVEVKTLKLKVSKAKKLGVTEYQESASYMSYLKKAVIVILVKKRIKL